MTDPEAGARVVGAGDAAGGAAGGAAGRSAAAGGAADHATTARRWLRGWAAAVHEARTRLTDLDAAIGDGDHGINLDRGLAAVVAELDVAAAVPAADGNPDGGAAGEVLGAAGRRLMGVVGGASGALYGRAFVRAGAAVGSAPGESWPEIALAAAIDSIAELGHAVPGEKTMLDALVPALDALRAAPPGTTLAEALVLAADAADEGALATFPLIARKGRASYLGERSVNHLDPGAVSAAMLVRALAQAAASA